MIMPYRNPGRRTSWCWGESGLSAHDAFDTSEYSFRSMNLRDVGNDRERKSVEERRQTQWVREHSQEHPELVPRVREVDEHDPLEQPRSDNLVRPVLGHTEHDLEL